MMFLIGSRAAAFWDEEFSLGLHGRLKDWDIIATEEDFQKFAEKFVDDIKICYPSSPHKVQIHMKNGDRFEFEFITPGSSNELLSLICHRKSLLGRADGIVIDNVAESFAFEYYKKVAFRVVPEVILYLIKRSHIYWNVNWFKNIEDLHYLKNRVSKNVLDSTDREFYTRRLIESSKKFGRFGKAKLNMSNDKFFEKSKRIERIYHHDDLHEVVRFGLQPAYQLAKNDPSKALLNKELFDQLDGKIKIWLVQEEAAVIALERYLIPIVESNILPNSDRIKLSYQRAHMRICTDLTSGWFRDFAINSWPESKDPGQDFFKIFLQEVKNKRLKRIGEKISTESTEFFP